MTPSTERSGNLRTGSLRHVPRPMSTVVSLGFAVSAGTCVVATALGRQHASRDGLGSAAPVFLVAAALVLGSVGLIPAGVLTDRHGARVTLPVITAVAAVSMPLTVVGTAVTRGAAVVVAAAAAGAVFSVGASAVARQRRPSRHGFGLSVFGAGIGAAAVAAVLVRPAAQALTPRGLALLSSGLLAAYAVLAWAVVRDAPAPARKIVLGQDVVSILRTSATRQWCVLSAVAYGPLFAMLLYLPTRTSGAYRHPWSDATILTATLIAVTAAARPIGGWLAGIGKAVPLLSTCYLVVGGLGVLIALGPPVQVVWVLLGLIAAASGAAGGGLLCRIGRTVPPERAGLITGVVGAVAGVSGLLPPALLWASHAIQGQYTTGIMALSGASIAAASHARRRQDWVNPLTLPLLHTKPVALEPAAFVSTGTTVVALAPADADVDRTVVLAVLTELATRQELIIVYGADGQPAADSLTPAQLVAAVRDRLPRHKIAAFLMDAHSPADSPDWTIAADLIADGVVAVAVVDPADLTIAAELVGRRLKADTVCRLTWDSADGIRLRPLPAVSVDRSAERPGDRRASAAGFDRQPD
jgi:NNP family nitrate/nitrite transporter-like MFS transporter